MLKGLCEGPGEAAGESLVKAWAAPICRQLGVDDFGLIWFDQRDEEEESWAQNMRLYLEGEGLVGEVYVTEREGRYVARWHCKLSDWREVVDEYDTTMECFVVAKARLLAKYIETKIW